MILLSLGGACFTKCRIDEYKASLGIDKGPTLFFDWIVSDDFNSVLNVLLFGPYGILDAKKLIEKDNTGKDAIYFGQFVAPHELHASYTQFDIDSFVHRYKKRYERILNIIWNSSEIINFVRVGGSLTQNQIQIFGYAMNRLNPKCNYRLFNVRIDENPTKLIKGDWFIEVDSNLYHKDQQEWEQSWTLPKIDWLKLFGDLRLQS